MKNLTILMIIILMKKIQSWNVKDQMASEKLSEGITSSVKQSKN